VKNEGIGNEEVCGSRFTQEAVYGVLVKRRREQREDRRVRSKPEGIRGV
jgi:hypothetical protein